MSKLQREHFGRMSRGEIEDVIRDAHRQIDYIALAETRSAELKREELQFRIDYLKELLKTL